MNRNIDKLSIKAENKVTKLRSKRKQFISTMQYEEAQKIDVEIADHHQSVIEEAVKIVVEEFIDALEAYLQRNVDNDSKVDEEKEVLLEEHRRKYHVIFKETQRKHLSELAVIEQRYMDNRMRETERCCPEQIHLLELSKKAAMNGDYEQALALRDKSRTISQQNMEERLKKIEEDFLAQRVEAINGYRGVFEQIIDKFNHGIEVIEKEAEKKHASIAVNRERQLLSYYQKSITKLSTVAKGHSMRQPEQKIISVLFSECDKYHYNRPPINTSQNLSDIPVKF